MTWLRVTARMDIEAANGYGILYAVVANENVAVPLAEESRIPKENKEIAEAIRRLCLQLLDTVAASGTEHKNSYNHDGCV